MKTVKIITYAQEVEIYMTCPKCKNCEGHPVDEQRHHLQSFEIIKWLDEKDGNEVSQMFCVSCGENFLAEWIYIDKDYCGQCEKELPIGTVINHNEDGWNSWECKSCGKKWED